ncbi:MAG: ABC transporter substrate-binding protein [Acidimicrobiales bacterium]
MRTIRTHGRAWARAASAVLLAAAALVGCGGGGSDGEEAVVTTAAAQAAIGSVTLDSDKLPATTLPARAAPQGKYTYGFNTAFSPAWMDPQEYPAQATPYLVAFAIHEGVVRHMPGRPLSPGLASSYKVADDYLSATFTLREGLTFHNGDPLTSEDVKFTYENYKGTASDLFKARTERVETPDARTVRFVFKQPFVDFLLLYGTPASGAGWVVPKKYYTEVGPDRYKQNPVGAGPFRFVRNNGGNELELEAFDGYWRRSAGVKTMVMKFITDNATRFAATQAGEIDVMTNLPATLLEVARNTPGMRVQPSVSGNFWLEMPGWERPDSPFHDVRVRKAVSLALDRKAISDAEAGGMASLEGTWIPQAWGGAIQPKDAPDAWRSDLVEAKRLMAEAGFPNGFEVSQLTPLPPFNSLAERVITQLAAIGIKTKLNIMERGAFLEATQKGVDGLPGLIINISSAPGDAASRVRAFATCKGSSSRTCIPELDAKFAVYETSVDAAERSRLLTEVQRILLDQYVFPFVYTQTNLGVFGPRIANEPKDVYGAMPQFPLLAPYEDVTVR